MDNNAVALLRLLLERGQGLGEAGLACRRLWVRSRGWRVAGWRIERGSGEGTIFGTRSLARWVVVVDDACIVNTCQVSDYCCSYDTIADKKLSTT